VAAPEQVDVWVGLDAGKKEHFADVLDDRGERLFARAVASNQADLETLLDRAARHGTPGLVTGQPGSIAQLALAVAARRGTPVAYMPGLVMRRAADLYPGEAKTGRRDAYVLAGTARTRRKQVHWLDASSDELLAQLRVLNGSGIDLAADATGRVISELAAELDRVTARRDALAAEIEEAFRSHPSAELLASMPGIRPRTGARILAEVGDGSPFASGSKLAAYAGLAPVTRQSGTSLNAETRSRRGNHRLKNAMFLAAFASLRDPASKAFHDRKRTEGKRRNAALICLARRRCDVILAMLRTGQHYQPARPAPGLPRAA
jgi:transposase